MLSIASTIGGLTFAVLAFVSFVLNRELVGPIPKPAVDESVFWGPGAPTAQDTSIRPFKINYGAEVIEEIRSQLSDTALAKLRDPLEGTTFNYGTNTKYLKTVLKYWRDDYLPKWEAKHQPYLNKFPQFKTRVQGLDLHFIHIKAQKQAQRHFPLLLMHGWPGSVVEFYDFIEKLQKEQGQFSFDLVVPSLPGFGFSEVRSTLPSLN